MLASLGLDALVGRHDQQHDANSAQTREGVVEKTLVARDVDEADLKILRFQVREAEIDRDATALFLRPAVAVDSGQCLDQPCLTVVDVSRGSDDGPSHGVGSKTVLRSRGSLAPDD